jgi:hypothetical protein
MLLLTDGRILVHSEPNCNGCTGNYNNWYTLTPDANGSYQKGTWTQVASFPSGYYPLFFGSAVLADGRVVAQGGEYNCAPSCSAQWQSKGAIYDPTANTWTATTAPANSNIGDAQSVVLPDGTWMLAECCAIVFGRSTFPVYYYFNESTLSFTAKSNSTDGKFDDFDEEGWNLLPDGQVLTVDAYTSNTVLTGTNSEIYNPSTNMWSTAGSTINQLWDSNCKLGRVAARRHPICHRLQRLLRGSHRGLQFQHRCLDCGTGFPLPRCSQRRTRCAGNQWQCHRRSQQLRRYLHCPRPFLRVEWLHLDRH